MAQQLSEVAWLVLRQAADTTNSTSSDADTPGNCASGNDYDGRMDVRISAIFVILVTSTFGAVFPVLANRHKRLGVPSWAFFIAKYFGSGVIIATAFIHLLAPANDALKDPCLTGPITDYDWPEGIALMTIFVLFFIELMAMRYASFGDPLSHGHSHGDSHGHSHGHDKSLEILNNNRSKSIIPTELPPRPESRSHSMTQALSHQPGEDHLGHTRDHNEAELEDQREPVLAESYAAQMTALFILEFGVIFHSIFIGLTLAVAGSEFNTLYVVLVFHQTFEGLGLGSRLAAAPWPKSKRWTPYLLGLGYGLSTPIAIAIGLGVRKTYPPNSQTTLIVNGVFDSISAGILIYTGLVELMAHEFMFSEVMRRASIKVVLAAFGTMCVGAGLMALLGKWA